MADPVEETAENASKDAGANANFPPPEIKHETPIEIISELSDSSSDESGGDSADAEIAVPAGGAASAANIAGGSAATAAPGGVVAHSYYIYELRGPKATAAAPAPIPQAILPTTAAAAAMASVIAGSNDGPIVASIMKAGRPHPVPIPVPKLFNSGIYKRSQIGLAVPTSTVTSTTAATRVGATALAKHPKIECFTSNVSSSIQAAREPTHTRVAERKIDLKKQFRVKCICRLSNPNPVDGAPAAECERKVRRAFKTSYTEVCGMDREYQRTVKKVLLEAVCDAEEDAEAGRNCDKCSP